MKATKYPPYACKCCGCANGDMFVDYYLSKHNRMPTPEESESFIQYRRIWNELNELRMEAAEYKRLESMRSRRGRRGRRGRRNKRIQ